MKLTIEEYVARIEKRLQNAKRDYEEEVRLTGSKEWTTKHKRDMSYIDGMLDALELLTGEQYSIIDEIKVVKL